MQYFKFNRETNNVEILDDRVLVIKEFRALLDPKRNKTKSDPSGENQELAQKEFIFMFLYFDWESPYFKFSEEDRRLAAIEDSGLTDKELEDPLFIEACNKYNDLQEKNQSIRLLKACMTTIDNVIYYLKNVDVNERSKPDGRPIFKTKDVIAEIKGAKDLITSINELEKEVKEGLSNETTLRGDVEPGFYD